MKKYDYIFLGAGCAGLSLLLHMKAAGLLTGKRILLIDRSSKKSNDRTWCFWESTPGFFENIVCNQWSQLWFHATGFSKQFDITPYQYKMIRGIDFYDYCFAQLAQHPGIDQLSGEISDVLVAGHVLTLQLNEQAYTFDSPVVFNSLYNADAAKKQNAVYLLQHFKGWMIETPQPFFNAAEATLMDFRVPQTHGTSFVYVLPLSATRALVEYTLFSEKVLPVQLYNEGLTNYLEAFLQLKDYRITAEEYGVIPMTNARFPWYKDGMYQLGTAGGQTKASSGYTFRFIQKQSAAIVRQLDENKFGRGNLPAAAPRKFKFYDAVLLQVLAHKYAAGSEVFKQLFAKNDSRDIFSFLDNESSFMQDIKILQTLPTVPFLKGAGTQLFKR